MPGEKYEILVQQIIKESGNTLSYPEACKAANRLMGFVKKVVEVNHRLEKEQTKTESKTLTELEPEKII